MRLDLSLVEVFCTVYEEGSFSGAARKLRLSQPTISAHIKNLEEAIGGADSEVRRLRPQRHLLQEALHADTRPTCRADELPAKWIGNAR